MVRALEALEDGDQREAVDLLLDALEDDPVIGATRCRVCHRWPGQTWTCPNVRYCARLEEAA